MDVVINLKNHIGQKTQSGASTKVLGKELYEYFFITLEGFHVDKIYLISSDENDVLCNKILAKFGKVFKFESIVSAKLTDASLIKRLVNNKKLKEHFIYFSQMSFHNINLQDMLDFHKYNDSYFTPCLMKQPRSFTPYGYLYIDQDKKIQAFNYKYFEDSDFLPYINTGIYLISKKSINEIQNNNNGIRLIEDLLKHLVFKKRKVMPYLSDRYNNLLATPEEYYNVHVDLLKGIVANDIVKVNVQANSYIPQNIKFGKNFNYLSPFMIAENALVGNNVKVTNSIIAGNAKIADNVTIENSFIGEDVVVEAHSVVKNAYLFNQFIPSNSYYDGNENN